MLTADLADGVKCLRVTCTRVSGRIVQLCQKATFTGQQLSGGHVSTGNGTFVE